MTIAEQILESVSILVKERGMNKFRRLDIRKQIGIDRHRWENSYNPIFQAMRIDHSGGAPTNRRTIYRNIQESKIWCSYSY